MKFYGYTESKSHLACNEWHKSEIREKLKEDIILYLFNWLKKPYESLFVERKYVALGIVSETAT